MSTSSTDAMQTILDKLTENMQVIYRKAVDADQSLAQLQQSGKGKFNHIFSEDAGFQVQSKRFMPYVEELAAHVSHLKPTEAEDFQAALPNIVKKMEQLLTTLSQFKTTL